MILKRSGSKIFGAHLTKNEHRALEIETRKMIVENERLYRLDMDAAYLYFLHIECGHGKKRLRRDWERFRALIDEVIAHYLVEDEEAPCVCRIKLRDIGVDVEEWYKEDEKCLTK